MKDSNPSLVLGGIGSLLVSLLHVACIYRGADWYRWLGAGEEMAQAALRGERFPAVVTALIAVVFFLWALYAWSGANLLGPLPLRKAALGAITAIYLARGLGFVALFGFFPGNSLTFWLVTSGVCTALGLLHLRGIRDAWATL